MVELIIWAILGLISGIFFGLIPGLGPFVAIALSYSFLQIADPIYIMMYYVSILIATNFTNSVTAIMYGIPGDASAIPTAKEGHRLFSRGLGHLAISSNAFSSLVGVLFSVIFFLLIFPKIILVFNFYNSIIQTLFILFAIFIILITNKQNKIHTFLFFILGGVIAKIGIDPVTYESFLTFNNSYLSLGIPFSAVMIGLYIVPEILKIQKINLTKPKKINKFVLGKNTFYSTLLGSFVGFWCGLIPGVTNILGSYLSANIVKKTFKMPVLKSIAAAEAANNSGALSSLLPLLILSIPITGSEILIYYLMIENGFEFDRDNIILYLKNIMYVIPFITLLCFVISLYGFNLLSQIVYFYSQHKTKINILILTTVSLTSIMLFPIHLWMIICLFLFTVLGYFLKNFDTSPIIYGFFLSDLFYENMIRTIVILS